MRTPERPVLRYFGGKWKLAPWILEHFPEHHIYVEPFGGGASVLMRKPRSYAEVYNDLDGEIVNVFRVLRDRGDELARALSLTPHSREEYDAAFEVSEDPVERARRCFIRSQMGFAAAGTGAVTKPGYRSFAEYSGQHPAKDWGSHAAHVPSFCERLRGVAIENKPAVEVMSQQDTAETLHFVDPPYVTATRGHKDGYRFEMTDDQHVELCDFLKTLKGMVILCGYEHPSYARLGWATSRRNALADGARERTEVLWLNPAAERAQAQGKLL